jgi:hypothetical protein
MKLQYLFYHSATCADIQTVKMAIMKNCGDHYDIKLDTHQKVVFILILDIRTQCELRSCLNPNQYPSKTAFKTFS